MTPSEVAEVFVMPEKEVLILPDLPRHGLSAQRVRYTPEDIENYVNARRVVQGFVSTALGTFLAGVRRPMTATAVSELLRVRREAVRDLLGAPPYPPEAVAALLAATRTIQAAA